MKIDKESIAGQTSAVIFWRKTGKYQEDKTGKLTFEMDT